MKKSIIFLVSILALSAQVNSQISFEKTVKRTEQKIENRINNKIDKGIDKSLDAVEDGIDDAVTGDKNDSKKKETENPSKTKTEKKSTEKQTKAAETDTKTASNGEIPQEKPAPVLEWSKYDFVPGTEIIFEDDFNGEKNGEFPSRWDMTKGTVEIANWGGENVVWFKKTNANVPDAILPLLKNRTEDYLPEEFTVEMDVFFHSDYNLNKQYYIFFYDSKNQTKILSSHRPSAPIRVQFDQITYDLQGDTYPGQDKLKPKEGWRHVAISFNKRALKGYLDDVRLVNIPNVEFNPTGIMISAHNTSGTGKPFVKNIRIAKGAVPLYDKFLTNGKFVTTGIKFDVNKATIKPESIGTINYVVKMMTEHPELKFSIEGHTDSDGDEASNLKLSEARAKTVMDQMVKLGIENTRLTSKGLGESKPMAGNDTPEGKAQNRRVEFVKF